MQTSQRIGLLNSESLTLNHSIIRGSRGRRKESSSVWLITKLRKDDAEREYWRSLCKFQLFLNVYLGSVQQQVNKSCVLRHLWQHVSQCIFTMMLLKVVGKLNLRIVSNLEIVSLYSLDWILNSFP